FHRRKCEADAVHRNGAFEDHESHDVRRRRNVQDMITADSFPAHDFADTINVTGNEMSAESPANRKGTFEVYGGTFRNKLQVGAFPGFAQEIEANQFAAA